MAARNNGKSRTGNRARQQTQDSTSEDVTFEQSPAAEDSAITPEPEEGATGANTGKSRGTRSRAGRGGRAGAKPSKRPKPVGEVLRERAERGTVERVSQSIRRHPVVTAGAVTVASAGVG